MRSSSPGWISCWSTTRRPWPVGVEDAPAQRGALHLVHYGEGQISLSLEPVEAHDVLVSQPRQRLGLAPEAAVELPVLGQVLAQHLDRHVVVALVAPGLVDLGHPALADELFSMSVLPDWVCHNPLSVPNLEVGAVQLHSRRPLVGNVHNDGGIFSTASFEL
jgi:hypothetical protein